MYSLAPDRLLECDNKVHIPHGLQRRAVPDALKILQGTKLDYVLVDYVHMSKPYLCDRILTADPSSPLIAAGKNMCDFVSGLINMCEL